MGLDMYLEKAIAPEGYTPLQAKYLKEKYDFLEIYESYKDIVKDPDKHLNLDDYFDQLDEVGNPMSQSVKRTELLNMYTEAIAEEAEHYNKLMSEDVVTGEEEAAVAYREDQVLYWRKENHIHNWFVDNIQDGVDDCESYMMEDKDVEELIALCQKIIRVSQDDTISDQEKKKVYIESLPTQEGFFFGSTDYDQYYLDSIQRTLDELKAAIGDGLAVNEALVYSSSW